MTNEKELAYQARIKEFRALFISFGNHRDTLDRHNSECPVCMALSRPDDLSALDAYVLEEKRKMLEEAANEFGETACIQDGTLVVEVLRKLAEELK